MNVSCKNCAHFKLRADWSESHLGGCSLCGPKADVMHYSDAVSEKSCFEFSPKSMEQLTAEVLAGVWDAPEDIVLGYLTEQFLASARLERSVQRLGRLIGYPSDEKSL